MGKYNGKSFIEDTQNRLLDLRGIKPNKTIFISNENWEVDNDHKYHDGKSYDYCDKGLLEKIKSGQMNEKELIFVKEYDIPNYVKDQGSENWLSHYIYGKQLTPTESYCVSESLGKSFENSHDWSREFVNQDIKFFSAKEMLLLDIITDYTRGKIYGEEAVLCNTELFAEYQELYNGEDLQAIKEQQINLLEQTKIGMFCTYKDGNSIFSEKGEPLFNLSYEGFALAMSYFEQQRLLLALFPDAHEHNEYIQSNGLSKVLLDSLDEIDLKKAVEIKNHFYGYRPHTVLEEWNDKKFTDQEMLLKKESFKEINPVHEVMKSEIKRAILDKLKEVLLDKPEVFEKISTGLFVKRGLVDPRQEQKVTEAFVIPDTIKGVRLSTEQRERFSQGKGVFVKNMKSDKDGKLFSGIAKINKETGEVGFRPAGHKKKNVQGQTTQKRAEGKQKQNLVKPTIVAAKPVVKAKGRRM